MLVYFVNHSIAPINLGGAERSLIQLVQDWYDRDPEFEAVFITKHPRGQFIKAIEEKGWAYKSFRYRGWTIPSVDAPLAEVTYFAREDYASTQGIIALMEERRPDLVVTNSIVAPWGAFAAKVLGIPHAWFVREYGDLDHGLAFQIGRERTFRDIGLLSEAVFANSIAVRDHIAQYIVDKPIQVVYPKVDVATLADKAAAAPTQEPFGPDAGLKISVVGRLADTKGQWRVIDAVGALEKRGIRASICLVGSWTDPDYDVQLMARARAAGIGERVTIVGEQDNPFPFVAAADVCVTASSIEAFGRTTLEYMLLSKPSIVSEDGGGAELVSDGETGALFSPDDPATLVEALEGYAGQPDRIRAHGAAARERAVRMTEHEYSNDAAIDTLLALEGAPAYKLPEIARYWFALPGHYSEMMKTGGQTTIRFVATRVKGRLRNLAKRPIAVVRRVVGR
ncbi:glycosyltransferase family 4 protein [Labedella endophytica]|uniref:Glycosyltransferase n=1 Tax=Labedella endophytica TaxID=1523160 RepID=A0A433JTK3_9MICO|nr:glycosyltransferase family 4 protein [Labedella endophytica]RUR01337.1 glycosyltransferase [Labedella endophytica]